MILKRSAAEKILGRKIEAPAWKRWYLLSADGTKNLGGYKTRKEAEGRERAVQYFKRNPEDDDSYRVLPLSVAKKDPMFRRGLEDHLPEFVPGLELHERAGFDVEVAVSDWGEGRVYLTRNVSAPKSLGGKLSALVWDSPREGGGISLLLTRSTRHGDWQLTSIDDYGPSGHSEIHDFSDIYEGITDEDHLRQVVFSDGTVMVRKGAKEIRYNPAAPKRKKDQISGGLADKYKASDFDQRELRMGVKVEMEHTRDRKLAREIAMDHLVEFPNYYTALEEMEEGLKAGKKKSGFLGKAHDWDQVLIDKDGKKLTRKKILDHYKKVEKKIWPFLKGQTVLVYIGTGRNKSVLRRKGPGGEYIKLTKLKGIEDPHSLEYWTHRRVIEFHPVITGKTTPLVWVDLDPNFTKATEAKLKRELKAAVPRIKAVLRKEFGVTSPHVYSSGKRGIHIEGDLPRAKDANRLRRLLRAAMDDEFSDDKTFTTGIPKGGQIRLDTTPIKHLGSIRAPYSMSVMGRAKLPLKAKAKAKAKKKAKPRRRKNPDESSLFHVTYVGRLAGVVEGGLAPGRGPSIGGESYNWNRRDSIFLSESDGVSYWYDLASRWAFDSSDDPAGDGLVPVVLRISGGPLTTDLGFDEFCEEDEVGEADSNRPTYKCKATIDPKHIQVWTGSSWVPVRRYGDIDLSSADDMHTWEDALMPVGKELESGRRKANPRRRRKPSVRRRRRNPDVQELSADQYDRLKALATDRKAHLWNEEPELEQIGIGGERIVYGLAVGDREPFAFKVDQGTKLHRQTEFEVKCLLKSNNPLAPEIFDWDRENHRWIEMELMTTLPDTDDPEAVFEKASGIDWGSWAFAFETYGGYLTDWAGVLKNLPTTPKAKRFIAMVRAFVDDCELSTSELGHSDNWGVTRDGKLKPLDLGY